MSAGQLYGHEQQREMFRRALSRGRLGHAYLFSGPRGIGKQRFARFLAQSLMCERHSAELLAPCGECAGCRQVLSGTHPDLFQVGLPTGKSELPIETFVGSPEKRGREGLCHDLAMAPMHGGYRVAIIDDADCMNVASANALLKTLEEPGPRSVLILIAEDPEQVIRTIRSRCQQVYFGPLSTDDLRSVVLQNAAVESQELPAERLELALAEANGSVQQAEAWLSRTEQGGAAIAHLNAVLTRPGFRVFELTQAAEQVISQFGSETREQRAGGQAILDCCLALCHRRLTESTQVEFREEFSHIRDAWGDAVELCLRTSVQLERRASVPLCLDAFYQELEICLRPTWKNVAAQS